MVLSEIIKKCCGLGRIEISDEVIGGETDGNPVAEYVRLRFCCNLLVCDLYRKFGKEPPAVRFEAFNDSVPLPDKALSEETFCFGVLAEYFLQIEDLPRYSVWNDRYESALENLRLCKRRKTMPVGRWI
ncbi:MAG: hypothetical protein NC132_04570 [Corallococcus sp.]|nr:hypothetical protein [Corallococcus sp.]MCM1359660.1 hypothetical protein [Corallococcus sp.]MCM1395369.1 hypothetical protein [Corallococcus sp.]